jgi:hypothetical protein
VRLCDTIDRRTADSVHCNDAVRVDLYTNDVPRSKVKTVVGFRLWRGGGMDKGRPSFTIREFMTISDAVNHANNISFLRLLQVARTLDVLSTTPPR